MYIIVIGWIYVVLMMSIAEDTAVAGVMTFLLYGVLPVSILVYLGGSRRRRRQRQPGNTLGAHTESTVISPEDQANLAPAKPETSDENAALPPQPPQPPQPPAER